MVDDGHAPQKPTMSDHDTRQPTDPTDPTDPTPSIPLGDADVRIGLDAGTYHRVRAAYERAVARGYPETFDTFAFNHCSVEWRVTVDGEPVAPDDGHGHGDGS